MMLTINFSYIYYLKNTSQQYQFIRQTNTSMQKIELEMTIDNIVHAFHTINNPSSQSSSIQAANQYLIQCQKQTQFVIVLFKLYSLCTQQQIALQSLLLATNVIKRNWKKNNRSGHISGDLNPIKEDIKKYVLKLYEDKFPQNVKHINELIKFLVRNQYPKNYLEFHEFILKKLEMINNTNETLSVKFVKQNVLPFLSTVKGAFKQYSSKRILQQNDNFMNFLVPVINIVLKIQNNMKQSAILKIQKYQIDPLQNVQIVLALFDCYRKCYKIVIYGLHCITPNLQINKQVSDMVYKYVVQIKNYRQLLEQWKNKEDPVKNIIQKNIVGLLDMLSKMQSQFPFIFTQFLDLYIEYLISILLQPIQYKFHKMLTQPIRCVTKLFQINCYFTPPNQYQNRNKSNKNKQMYIKEQQICYNKFTTIFSEENVIQFLQKIINQLLVFHLKHKGIDQQIDQNLQDKDQSYLSVATNDLSSGQLLLILIRNLIRCFKKTSYKVLIQVLDHLIVNLEKVKENRSVLDNLIELILLMPKLYDTTQLPLQKILHFLEILYNHKQFIYFSRLIRAYIDQFDTGSFKKLFISLYQFICLSSSDVSPKALYYSLLCVKKMLTQQQQIPQEYVQGCIQKIFYLMKVYEKNPSHLWNLVSLTNQFLKSLTQQTIVGIVDRVIQHLEPLLKLHNSSQALVMGLCDMILNLLSAIARLIQQSIKKCLNFIIINLTNKNLQTPHILFKLLLHLAKKYEAVNCTEETNTKMRQIMLSWSKIMQKQDPETYLQLIQQYMLGGLIYLQNVQLTSFIEKYNLEKQEINLRISMPIYSLYFSYSLKTNSYLQGFVLLMIKDLIKMHKVVSPYYTILKTLLLTILNHHVICFGMEKIYNIFNGNYRDFKEWFYPYCANLQYANSKYAYKVITLGLLHSLEYFNSKNILFNKVNDLLPIQIIIKVMMIQLDPMKYQKALSSFATLYKLGSKFNKKQSNPFLNRKICIQISQDLCKQDLKDIFRQNINNLLKKQHKSQQHLIAILGENNYSKMKTLLEDRSYQFKVDN